MIAANGAIARFLEGAQFPVLRRVVRSPERWQRIVDLAAHLGDTLPADAGRALRCTSSCSRRRAADPLRFPDLSLSVIKLLGRGEYAASLPGQDGDRPLRARGERLHALDRAQPALSRPLTQRLSEGRARRRGGAVRAGRSCARSRPTARRGGRGAEGRATVAQVGGRVLPRRPDRRRVRRHRHWGESKGTWVRVFDPPVEGRSSTATTDSMSATGARQALAYRPRARLLDFARAGYGSVTHAHRGGGRRAS